MRLRLDLPAALTALAAAIVVNALLFTAGWMIGAFAGGPAIAAPVAAAALPPPTPTPTPLSAVIVELRPTPVSPPAPPPEPSYDRLIRAAALRNGVPPLLVAAVTRVESDFDPGELSDKGARGLMQVMPATGERFGVAADRLFDPAPNIAAGTAYLAWLLDHYRGDLDLTLAAYNAGEGAVDRYRGIPPYAETRMYVKRVRVELARLYRR